jgi:hypothetical protein
MVGSRVVKSHEDDGLRTRATLPVFALSKDPGPDEAVRSLAASVIAPSATVNIDPGTSSVWIANDALWRLPAITPSSIDALPRTLPGSRSHGLSPVVRSLEQRTNGIRVRADPAWSDGARLVIWERAGWTRTHRFLDRTDGYALSLDAPDHDLDGVPLTGAGAVVTTRTGPRGEPFGIHAAVPRPTGARLELPIVDRASADEKVREGLRGFDCVRLDATLTYRVVETPGGPYLCPHWAYDIVARHEDRDVPLASRCVPAVEIELLSPASIAVPSHVANDDQVVGWTGAATEPRFLLSWLGEETGRIRLSRVARDAIIASLSQCGWRCRDFGEHAAMEAHWNRLADGAIRQADLAGYIGHAAAYGMKFNPPDAAWLESSACRFGGRLKWIVIDGCGPLQDEVAASGASAFDLWARAFQGLRALLGFATTQEQNARQFSRAIEYSLRGQPLARAWFQAVCECQGTLTNHGKPAWVAGLFSVDGTDTTIDDRLADAQQLQPLDEPGQLAGVWVPLG